MQLGARQRRLLLLLLLLLSIGGNVLQRLLLLVLWLLLGLFLLHFLLMQSGRCGVGELRQVAGAPDKRLDGAGGERVLLQLSLLRVPRLGLGAKVLEILGVLVVEHGLVVDGHAVVAMLFVEGLVAAVEQVELGKVERRIGVAVECAVLVAQEAEETWAALGRELAVEDDEHAFVASARLRRVAHQRTRVGEEELEQALARVHVVRRAYVAGVVLVRIARVDDDDAVDVRGVVAVEEARQRLRLDHAQVVVLDARLAGQDVEARAVADQALLVDVAGELLFALVRCLAGCVHMMLLLLLLLLLGQVRAERDALGQVGVELERVDVEQLRLVRLVLERLDDGLVALLVDLVDGGRWPRRLVELVHEDAIERLLDERERVVVRVGLMLLGRYDLCRAVDADGSRLLSLLLLCRRRRRRREEAAASGGRFGDARRRHRGVEQHGERVVGEAGAHHVDAARVRLVKLVVETGGRRQQHALVVLVHAHMSVQRWQLHDWWWWLLLLLLLLLLALQGRRVIHAVGELFAGMGEQSGEASRRLVDQVGRNDAQLVPPVVLVCASNFTEIFHIIIVARWGQNNERSLRLTSRPTRRRAGASSTGSRHSRTRRTGR